MQVCVPHAVRPNGTKASESGTEKNILQCHERRRVAHILRSPKLSAKPVVGNVREGYS